MKATAAKKRVQSETDLFRYVNPNMFATIDRDLTKQLRVCTDNDMEYIHILLVTNIYGRLHRKASKVALFVILIPTKYVMSQPIICSYVSSNFCSY